MPSTPAATHSHTRRTAAAFAALAVLLVASPVRAGEPDELKEESLDVYFERCAEPTESARRIAAAQWDNLLAIGHSPRSLHDIASTLPEDCDYASFRNAIQSWAREREQAPLTPASDSGQPRERPWVGQGYDVGGDDAADPPLTNDDVLTMHAAGLSASVVAAKVGQAPATDFDLEVDTLLALKDQGLPDVVVEAMLQADGAASEEDEEEASIVPEVDRLRVWLDADDKDVELSPRSGSGDEEAMTLRVVFDGTSSRVSTTDTTPKLYVAHPVDPVGLLYISEVEVDRDEGMRWCGVENPMSYLSWKDLPVPDDEIRYRTEWVEPGLWRLVLRDELNRQDKYALWTVASDGRRLALLIFDFEVRRK